MSALYISFEYMTRHRFSHETLWWNCTTIYLASGLKPHWSTIATDKNEDV